MTDEEELRTRWRSEYYRNKNESKPGLKAYAVLLAIVVGIASFMLILNQPPAYEPEEKIEIKDEAQAEALTLGLSRLAIASGASVSELRNIDLSP